MADTAVAQPPASTLPKSGKQPLIKKKLGNISVAVFSEEVSGKDGDVFTAYSFSLQKSWKDKSGNWQNHTISLKRREILQVQAALGEAFVASYLTDPDSTDE